MLLYGAIFSRYSHILKSMSISFFFSPKLCHSNGIVRNRFSFGYANKHACHVTMALCTDWQLSLFSHDRLNGLLCLQVFRCLTHRFIGLNSLLWWMAFCTMYSCFFLYIYNFWLIFYHRYRCTEEAGDWWRGLSLGRVCGCYQPHSSTLVWYYSTVS